MSTAKAKEFFNRLEVDEVFRNEFLKDETISKGNTESIFRAAARRGYEFTQNDIDEARQEMAEANLSDEELEKISAGTIGAGACFIIGAGAFINQFSEYANTVSFAFCLGLGLG